MKTIRASLTAVNAARAELDTLRIDHDRTAIERAAAAKSHEELDKLETDVAKFRARRDLAFGALLAAYATLGLAVALDDNASLKAALAAASDVALAVAALKKGTP